MISLIELILKEAKQVGTLYHFTSYFNAVDIIDEDFKLSAKYSPEFREGEEEYISFTRNKSLRSTTITTGAVRFIIDGNKLSNKYKIIPYADFYHEYGRNQDGGDESEERINAAKYNGVVDFKKELVQIDIIKLEKSESYRLIIENLDSKGIKYNLVDKF